MNVRTMTAIACTVLALTTVACKPRPTRQAEILLASGDSDAAAERAAGLVAKNPNDTESQRILIAALGDGGRMKEATDAYIAWVKNTGKHDRDSLDDLAHFALREALASKDAKTRAAAILVIEQLQLTALADAVAKRMNDNNDVVAATATIAVLHGYEDTAQSLESLYENGSPQVRAILLRGLLSKARAKALPLYRTASTDKVASTRALGIQGVALYSKDENALWTAHSKDADSEVQAALFRYVAVKIPCDRRKALEPAQPARDEVMRAYIVMLDKSNHCGTWASERLATMLTGSNFDLALQAAQALGAKDARTHTFASELLASNSPDKVRAGLLFDKSALTTEQLQGFASNAEPSIALLAADGLLAQKQTALATDAYVRLLTSNSDIRLAAATALAKLGDARGNQAMLQLLASNNETPRVLAAFQYARDLPVDIVSYLSAPDTNSVVTAETILTFLYR